MRILIIGSAGMIGQKLLQRLVGRQRIGNQEIADLQGFDVAETTVPPGDMPVQASTGDLSEPAAASRIIESRPDLIFHLAAVVSGEAEEDFEKGYSSNLDGTRRLLEAIRLAGDYRPRFVFASSIAVYGAPFPDSIPDDFFHTPLTSYGTQKAIGELLVSDYSRRGFVEGIGLRLPTICVRPGKPNKAASGFFSSIIREPLIGQEAVLPVSEQVRHWFASPRAAVQFLIHAAELDLSRLGPRRNLTMPGVSATVREQINALRRIAGDRAIGWIRREPDQSIMQMVEGWPKRFDAKRAIALGFQAESSFEEIIRIHVEDELGGKLNF